MARDSYSFMAALPLHGLMSAMIILQFGARIAIQHHQVKSRKLFKTSSKEISVLLLRLKAKHATGETGKT